MVEAAKDKKGAKADAKADAKEPAKQAAPAARPKAAAPAARPAARPRPPRTQAEKIVEKMVKASGGRAAMNAIKSMYMVGKTRLVTVLGERTAKMVAYEIKPSYQRLDMSFGKQTITQSFTPAGGWMRQNGAIFQLPRSMVEMTKAEMARTNLELRYALEPITVSLIKVRSIRGVDCYVIVFVDQKKNRTTYYISKKDHTLIKRSYVGPSPLGTGKQRFTTYHSDFRWVPIPGTKLRIRLAFRVENHIGGRKVGTILMRKAEINPKHVTKQTFQRPSPVE